MESNEVVNTKINPILIVVGIILIIVSAIIGWYVGGNKDNRPLEKEEIKTEEKVEEKSTYEVELFDEKNSYYTDISLKDESLIKSFVKSADFMTNNDLRQTFLEGDAVSLDTFKIAYIFNSFVYDQGGIYYFSTEFLNNEIKKVFSDGISLESYFTGHVTLRANELKYTCVEQFCVVESIVGGGAGVSQPVTEIVSSRSDGENTIYTLKEYYSEFDGGNFVVEGGELLCEYGNCPEDIVGTYGDKLNTYEMTFDKDNRYVSSKKVS